MGEMVRLGDGGAVGPALLDERPVSGLQWYTVRSPGAAGWIGAKHSLLAVCLDADGKEPSYVIEKAQPRLGNTNEQFRNGVHVSHWEDVLPSLHGEPPLHQIGPDGIREPRHTLQQLREIAVQQGPYHLSLRNCHHCAFVLFNAVAVDKARVPDMPNKVVMSAAGLMEALAPGSKASVEQRATALAHHFVGELCCVSQEDREVAT